MDGERGSVGTCLLLVLVFVVTSYSLLIFWSIWPLIRESEPALMSGLLVSLRVTQGFVLPLTLELPARISKKLRPLIVCLAFSSHTMIFWGWVIIDTLCVACTLTMSRMVAAGSRREARESTFMSWSFGWKAEIWGCCLASPKGVITKCYTFTYS